MRRIINIIITICVILMLGSIGCYNVSAAGTGSIKLAGGTKYTGETITITGTITGTEVLAGATVNMTYNTTALDYVDNSGAGGTFNVNEGAGSIKFGAIGSSNTKSFSFTMKFKILTAITSQVKVESYQVVDLMNADEVTITQVTSATITGKAQSKPTTPTTPSKPSTPSTPAKDKNNKLSSLQVYPGTLSPAFSAGTTSYNVTVPESTSEVTISANPQSSKATVTVSGGKNLKLGVNTAQVVVVAENGSSLAYNITIMCGEKEQITVKGASYTIYEDFTDEQIPTGFSRTKVVYNGREYEGLVNGNVALISLENEAGNVFFIYNQKTQEFYDFLQIAIAEGKYIIPLPLNDKVEQFKKAETTSLAIQEKNFDAWKLDDEFSVVYVLNQDGQEVLYRYDSIDGIFQRYTQTELPDSGSEQKALFPDQYYMYTIIGLGTLCVILFICMIYFIASRKHRHEGRKKKVQREQEKQKKKEEKRLAKEKQNEEQ